MSVIDASVFVDAMIGDGRHGERAKEAIGSVLLVPTIFGAEVASALRSMVARGELALEPAEKALESARRARMIRFPFEPLCERVWELRHNLTVHDAWYVALAEGLATDLITADERLVGASGPRCVVRLP